jgi:hypothetical protein
VVDGLSKSCYNTYINNAIEGNKMGKVVFHTAGNGLWSGEERAVTVTDMKLGYVSDELDFGELCVYFNTKSWDVTKYGLIYTDRQFLRELREFLDAQGLPGDDVDYSEQGMQGRNYVSLDVCEDFLTAWSAKFGVDLQAKVDADNKAFEARWA